jgi:hypothetical protein
MTSETIRVWEIIHKFPLDECPDQEMRRWTWTKMIRRWENRTGGSSTEKYEPIECLCEKCIGLVVTSTPFMVLDDGYRSLLHAIMMDQPNSYASHIARDLLNDHQPVSCEEYNARNLAKDHRSTNLSSDNTQDLPNDHQPENIIRLSSRVCKIILQALMIQKTKGISPESEYAFYCMYELCKYVYCNSSKIFFNFAINIITRELPKDGFGDPLDDKLLDQLELDSNKAMSLVMRSVDLDYNLSSCYHQPTTYMLHKWLADLDANS